MVFIPYNIVCFIYIIYKKLLTALNCPILAQPWQQAEVQLVMLPATVNFCIFVKLDEKILPFFPSNATNNVSALQNGSL